MRRKIPIAEQTDARRERRGAAEAVKLAHDMDRVIAARGKRVAVFEMRKSPPDDATLLQHLLGPSGNLRAPALRVGKTLYVGFDEASLDQVLG